MPTRIKMMPSIDYLKSKYTFLKDLFDDTLDDEGDCNTSSGIDSSKEESSYVSARIENINNVIMYQKKLEREEMARKLKEEQYNNEVMEMCVELGFSEEIIKDCNKNEADEIKKADTLINLIQSENLLLESHTTTELSSNEESKPCTETIQKAIPTSSTTTLNSNRSLSRMRLKHMKESNNFICIQDRPAWLEAIHKGPLRHAREERILRADIDRMERNEILPKDVKEYKLKMLRKRLIDITVTPKLTYKDWTSHITIAPQSTINTEIADYGIHENYHRYDSIGWTKKDGYIMGLTSPLCKKNAQELYNVLNPYLMVTSKLNRGESRHPCIVLEIGSGSGEHAVLFCERNPKTIIWQPSDKSQRCIDTVDNRARLHRVYRDDSVGEGNCMKSILIDCASIETNKKNIKDPFHSVDALVCINIIPYMSRRSVEKLIAFANASVREGGFFFVYSIFFFDGDGDRHTNPSSSETHEKLNTRVKFLCPENGVWSFSDFTGKVQDNGFKLEKSYDMNYDFKGIVFRKEACKCT